VGGQLMSDLHLRLDPGESLIITGKSATGKSTLLGSLAELWPYTSGTMHCPGGEHETMFLSQLPPFARHRLRQRHPPQHRQPAPSETPGTAGQRRVAVGQG